MSVEVGRELGVCGYNLARPGAGVPRAQAPGQGGMCVCICVSQVGGGCDSALSFLHRHGLLKVSCPLRQCLIDLDESHV